MANLIVSNAHPSYPIHPRQSIGATYCGSYLHFPYVDQDLKIRLISYNYSTKTWGTSIVIDDTAVYDDHGYPQTCLDNSNYLWIVYSGHAASDPHRIKRSTNTADRDATEITFGSTLLIFPLANRKIVTTYPTILHDPNTGRIYLGTRWTDQSTVTPRITYISLFVNDTGVNDGDGWGYKYDSFADLNNWDVIESPPDTSVTLDNTAMKLHDESTTLYAQAEWQFATDWNSDLFIQWFMKGASDGAGDYRCFARIFGLATGSPLYLRLQFLNSTTGVLTYYDGAYNTIYSSWAAGTWYCIRVYFHRKSDGTGTWSLYVLDLNYNLLAKVDDIPFYATSAEGWGKIRFNTGTAQKGDFWVDSGWIQRCYLPCRSYDTNETNYCLYIGKILLGKEPSGTQSIHIVGHNFDYDYEAEWWYGRRDTYYLKSPDGGLTYLKGDGSEYTKPATPNNATAARRFDYVKESNKSDYFSMADTDPDSNIHIIWYDNGDYYAGVPGAHPVLRYAYWNNGAWSADNNVTPLDKDYDYGNFCINPETGRGYMVCERLGGAKQEISKWITEALKDEASWIEEYLTEDSDYSSYFPIIQWIYAEGQGIAIWSTRDNTPTSSSLYFILIIGIPTAQTNAATLVTTTTARLNGEVTDDGGEACEGRFRWKKGVAGEYSYTPWEDGLGTNDTFYKVIDSLDPGSVYYVNAQVRNSAGESEWGAEESFETLTTVETIVAQEFPMGYYQTTGVKELRSKVSGATVTKVANNFPHVLIKSGKAQELTSKWS